MFVNDEFECYTLEDVDRHLEDGGLKVQNQTCIPRGTYQVVVDFSPHFQRNMPHILNVPQFSGVRIHSGNTDADTEGCILVGLSRDTDFVGKSVLAFDAMFSKILAANSAGEEIILEVK